MGIRQFLTRDHRMNKDTIRLLLSNQEEIMRALAVLASKHECVSTVALLNEAAHKTSVHRAENYPHYAPVTRI